MKALQLTFSAEDLREGQEYHFRVAAVNAEGQGPFLEGKDTFTPLRKIRESIWPGSSKVLFKSKPFQDILRGIL